MAKIRWGGFYRSSREEMKDAVVDLMSHLLDNLLHVRVIPQL